jgi:hypothetical protein
MYVQKNHFRPANVNAVPEASSTSLTADQPFQISATVTFQALTIASGTALSSAPTQLGPAFAEYPVRDSSWTSMETDGGPM